MSTQNSAEILEISKACIRCKAVQPLSQFAKDKNYPSGHIGACKTCISVSSRTYRQKEGYKQKKYAKDKAKLALEKKSRIYLTCNSCKKKKLRDEFNADESHATGVDTNRCKKCHIIRTCSTCKEEKPVSAFKIKRKGSIAATCCKGCSNIMQRKWRSGNAEAKEQARYHRLQRRYDLHKEAFEALYNSQGGKCAICRKEFSSHPKACVDHCHHTGKVRGLLCVNCNSGIGHFGDDIGLVELAVKYLRDRKMR